MLGNGTRVSVTEKGVVYPGTVVKGRSDGLNEVAFDNGDEGDYAEAELTVIGITPPTQTVKPKPVLSQEELERKVDENRKAAVDATNAQTAKNMEKLDAELASVPLTDEEMAFMAEIKPRMNHGRRGLMPNASDITRYARLVKRSTI